MPKRTEEQKRKRAEYEKARRVGWDPRNPRECACGCGHAVESMYTKYIHGHHMRMDEYKTHCFKPTPSKTKKCPQCGANFVIERSERKFCSNSCKHIARNNKVIINCLGCKQEMLIRPCEVGKRTCCSRKCRKEYAKALRHQGVAGSHASYRKTAYELYDERCCFCGYAEYPEILVVHHLDADRSNNHPDNLAIVCPTCHAVAHLHMGRKKVLALVPRAYTRSRAYMEAARIQ